MEGNDLAQVGQVGQGLENILKEVGEQLARSPMGLQIAELVRGITAWKENL